MKEIYKKETGLSSYSEFVFKGVRLYNDAYIKWLEEKAAASMDIEYLITIDKDFNYSVCMQWEGLKEQIQFGECFSIEEVYEATKDIRDKYFCIIIRDE